MGIIDIPWYDRPGARLSREGAEKLSNADLLEIIIGKSKKESVIKIANRLLKKYNLNKLDDLSEKELTKECGGDGVAAKKILSFLELSKRYNKLIKGGYNFKPISSAKDVYNMFVDKLRNKKQEVLSIVLLDAMHNPIKIKEISTGTLDTSLIHPREVFKEAIKESAHSIIIIHNHPSGNCTPSKGDEYTTEKIKDAGKLLKINLIDHVIIGKNKYYSFREDKKLI